MAGVFFCLSVEVVVRVEPEGYGRRPVFSLQSGSFFWGEMAEWLKAHAWKACLGETLTWVRIPLSPPFCNPSTIFDHCEASPRALRAIETSAGGIDGCATHWWRPAKNCWWAPAPRSMTQAVSAVRRREPGSRAVRGPRATLRSSQTPVGLNESRPRTLLDRKPSPFFLLQIARSRDLDKLRTAVGR